MRDRDRVLLKHYYREIKSYLPCSRKEKKRILKEIRGNVDSFLEDHPEADFEAIQTHFGTPHLISVSCVENMDTVKLLKALKIRKRIITAVAATLLAALLLRAIGLAAAYLEFYNDIHGYTETWIEEVDTTNETQETQEPPSSLIPTPSP